MSGSLARFRSYLGSLSSHFNSSGDRAPFITISRQAGAGGITIARLVAERLREREAKSGYLGSWSVFDKTLVDEVLQDATLSRQLLEFTAGEGLSEAQEILQDLFGLHPPKWSQVRKTSETILRLAQMGRVILVGQGANIITGRLEGGLHVRLVGSPKKRIEHLKEYFGFDSAEAAEFVRREDEARRRFVKKYFGKDIEDPLLYDLVVDTDDISYEQTAALIVYTVKHAVLVPSSLEA